MGGGSVGRTSGLRGIGMRRPLCGVRRGWVVVKVGVGMRVGVSLK